ncbi:MAG: hypothetical protein OSB21_09655, partial [Myxococcota bacterium]|nr:hypothetical protein [Myxococcota bacterium]
MIETFDAMAGRIDQLWRKNEDAAQALSQVAKQVLTEFSAQLDKLDPGSLAEAALRMDRPQFKVESPFGDPPVTWFMGDGYVIESYYWMRNTTSVHDHSFSGAWCTLLGSSVHRQFRFTMHQELTSSLSVGHLEQLSQERLLPGDVRMIVPGNDFIHDLFHLEQPTLTLIIRSCSSSKDSGLARQREYIGFGATAFAWQSFSRPSNERLSERLLTSLATVDQPLAMRLFDGLVEKSSP